MRESEEMTYNFPQDVDLVEQHAFLIIIHVALPEHFHSSLRTRLSVHTHAHLSKRTCESWLAK